MPVDPGPAAYRFLPERAQPGTDLVGLGADLTAASLLEAYRSGVFPMGLGPNGRGSLGWWSPDPRGVLVPAELRISRSLGRARRRFRVSVDTAYDQVVAGCADPSRPGRWITPEIAAAYQQMHRLGWVHSVEVWDDEGLAGGLYGVAIGGLFAGESMFHRATDASKVALVALVELLDDGVAGRLVDVQWLTPHLASLGARAVPRTVYLRAAREAMAGPEPAWPQRDQPAGSSAADPTGSGEPD